MPRLIEPRTWGVMTLVAEAASEGLVGMTAVAEVIRNRMAQKYFSDGTVAGTVLFPLAFSCWNTKGTPRGRHANLDDNDPSVVLAYKAWDAAFEQGSNEARGAVMYHADYVNPSWASKALKVRTIKRHIFYVEKGT